MLISNPRSEARFLSIPDHIFERLLDKYPKGLLPQVEQCYFLLLTPVFGKPFVLPDFVFSINLPVGWKTVNRQDLKSLAGNGFAPKRGIGLSQSFQDKWLSQAECISGFVAWLPSPDTAKPWLFKEGSSLVRNGGVPDFKYGDTIEQALKEFLE